MLDGPALLIRVICSSITGKLLKDFLNYFKKCKNKSLVIPN